jgi:hypothetical protein
MDAAARCTGGSVRFAWPRSTKFALPSPRTVLELLPKARLLELSRDLGVVVRSSANKEEQVSALARGQGGLPGILRALGRDELKRACRQHGLDECGRSRDELARRILGACQAADESRAPAAPGLSPLSARGRHRERAAAAVSVTEVVARAYEEAMTIVRLVCLDETLRDAPGAPAA